MARLVSSVSSLLPVVGALRRRRQDGEEVVGELDRRVVPAARLVDRPERLAQRRPAASRSFRPTAVAPGDPEVVELGGGRCSRRRRPRASVREVAGVGVAGRLANSGCVVELRRRVLLDRLEHHDPRRRRRRPSRRSAGPGSCRGASRGRRSRPARAGGVVQVRRHRLDRLDRRAGEDRQELEEALLGRLRSW